MKLKITLENDNNLIFRAGGDAGNVVMKWDWLPKVKFNGEGEKLYISEYLKLQVWSYLKETLFVSNSSRERNGVFNMTSSIKRPRYVFIFALNTAKLDDKTQNVYAHNTFSIANNRMVNHAQLEVENGIYCPEGPYIGTEQSRLFTALLEYKKWCFNTISHNPW